MAKIVVRHMRERVIIRAVGWFSGFDCNLPTLTDSDRRAISKRLLASYPSNARQDWRVWSWSRDRAQRTVNANRGLLAP